MSLNLNGVRIFVAVVEAQSFTRAAAALFISQPAVSKAVQELERQIGLPLIERGGQGITLSEAGRHLYQHGQAIFAAERSAEQELAALRGLDHGNLHLGASTTIATYMLPPVVGRFHRHYPGITVALTSANTQEISELLLDYRLDVALVEGPVTHLQIEVIPWRTDHLIVIADPGSPLANGAAVSLAQLAEAPFIGRERGSGTREVAEQALLERGIEPHMILELGSTEAIKQAVAAGLGVAMVSRSTVQDQVALGKLVVLNVEGLIVERRLNQLVRRGRIAGPVVRAFAPFLGDEGL
ncbi:MAG: LysR family transcriptional regulator [Herpetosiphon sp.]